MLDSGTNTAATLKEKFKLERYLLLFTRCYCSCLSSVDIKFFEVTQTNYYFFSRFTSLPHTEGFWKARKDPRYKGTYSYCLIRHSEVIKIISIKCIITYPSCTYCACCEERALKLPIFHFNISQNCFKTPKIYLI